MVKQYIIRFDLLEGGESVIKVITVDLDKVISEYSRNKPIIGYEILEESSAEGIKELLLG